MNNLNKKRTASGKKYVCIMKIILSMICALAVTQTLWAGIAVDPTFTEVSLLRGQSNQGTYTVVNNGAAPVIITIEPMDWLKRYLEKKKYC